MSLGASVEPFAGVQVPNVAFASVMVAEVIVTLPVFFATMVYVMVWPTAL